tara:strand:+ start:276 stop:551 length:276 start_codon:yes stop_codon:yes gene_type:complete
MSYPLVGGVREPLGATEVVARAAEAAGESLLDSAWPLLSQYWWLPALLIGLRILQPVLFKLSQKTKTRWDDKIVRVLAWVLGAVERRKDDQ